MMLQQEQLFYPCETNLNLNTSLDITQFVILPNLYFGKDWDSSGVLFLEQKNNLQTINSLLSSTKILSQEELGWLNQFGIETIGEFFSLDRDDPRTKEIFNPQVWDYVHIHEKLMDFVQQSVKIKKEKTSDFTLLSFFHSQSEICVCIYFPPLAIQIVAPVASENELLNNVLDIVSNLSTKHLFIVHSGLSTVNLVLNNSLQRYMPGLENYIALKKKAISIGYHSPIAATSVKDQSLNAVMMLYFVLCKEFSNS